MYACGCFLRGLGMEDSHGLLLGDWEATAYKAPIFFDFAHPAFLSDGECVDGMEQLLDKVEGCIEVIGLVVFNFEGEQRVVEYATPNHEVVNSGKPLADAAEVGGSADVAVVDDFVANERQRPTEGVEVYLAGVLLAACAWMYGDIE